MRALDVEVVDETWAAIEPLLPEIVDEHPLGCHRARVPDRLCLWGTLIRLTTGASWVDVEAILEHRVSDTTLPARRDEWIAAGVFEELKSEALAAFDRIIGLDLSEVSLDGSLHKAPYEGEGTGPNPTDRGKLGWKWSVASERHGVPIGWTIDGANRNDIRMPIPTVEAVAAAGLHLDIDTLHLDRGYDYPVVREWLAGFGLDDLDIQQQGTKEPGRPSRSGSGCAGSSKRPTRGGRTTDSLHRNTDRRRRHRHAALSLATTILVVGSRRGRFDHRVRQATGAKSTSSSAAPSPTQLDVGSCHATSPWPPTHPGCVRSQGRTANLERL